MNTNYHSQYTKKLNKKKKKIGIKQNDIHFHTHLCNILNFDFCGY